MDTPTILIAQTGNFNFFNALSWKTAAFLEPIKNKAHIVYIDPYIRDGQKNEVVQKLNATRLKIAEFLSTSKPVTYNEAYSAICELMHYHNPDYFVFINGNTNIFYNRDLEIYNGLFANVKLHPDEPMINWAPAFPEMHLNYFVHFIMLEWCAQQSTKDVIVHNIWEDPLQHKFDYIEGLNVKQWYFHKLPDMTYKQAIGKAAYTNWLSRKKLGICEDFDKASLVASNDETHTKTHDVQFEFCPSQEYWYFNEITKQSIHSTKTTKHLNFVFALTDSWLQKDDRAQLILKLEKFADSSYLMSHKFFFHYTSKRQTYKGNAWLYNDKLIPYDDYLKHIASSKFTLIIPSYDVNCFSLRRFFESLTADCIPLILYNCNYEWGLNQGSEIIQFVKDNLLITEDDLEHLPDVVAEKAKHYDELLQQLKSTTWWKTYTNPKFYRRTLLDMFHV